MGRNFLIVMGICAVLVWMDYLDGKALVVAFVAFFVGWNTGLPESEKRRLEREEQGRPRGPIE